MTHHFTSLGVNALPFAIAIIDLPLTSANSRQQHKFKSDKKRGIVITAGSNLVIFKKEIKEGEQKLKNDIMVTHRYQSLIQNNTDNEIEDFLVNHPYQCEIIMTNVSPKSKRVTLLFQIPNGSLPLQKTKYINSKEYTLSPYTTQKHKIEFYFPKVGKFDHAPSYISENLIVTAKSSVNKLDVGKKIIIKKVETFRDLMMTTRGEKAKKDVMLDLFAKKDDLVLDDKFQFSFNNHVLYVLYNDLEMYIKAMKLLKSKIPYNRDLYQIAYD